jgi:hypothetical protein
MKILLGDINAKVYIEELKLNIGNESLMVMIMVSGAIIIDHNRPNL